MVCCAGLLRREATIAEAAAAHQVDRSTTDPSKRAVISYSRKDKAFVEALVDDLQGRGITVWIDRRDIPPTAEWMAEIEDGIRCSDNFMFLISPDSIQSGTCLAELAHAERYNKRIVPVRHREVELAVARRRRSRCHRSMAGVRP